MASHSFEIDEEAVAALPLDAQDEVRAALERINQLRDANPLQFYFPHQKQHTFHSFRGNQKIFLGGNQSGKTTAGIADDLIQAVDSEVLPVHLRQYKQWEPPFRCRIMAPSIQIVETVLFEKIRELLPVSQLLGGKWTSAYDKQLRILHFENGGFFHFFTYEQDKSKLGGATVHRIHYDEEPPQGHRVESRIRVMREEGDELFTMTPVEGLTWAYDEWKDLVEEAEKRGGSYRRGKKGLVLVDMDDNPVLTEASKAEALAGLSNEERLARKSGRFVALHGLIFNDFDPAVHVVPERPIPGNVNVVVGIDPGIRYACGVIWCYLTPDDTMVAFEEGYFQDMTVERVAEAIHRINGELGLEPIYYVIDPAGRNRQSQTGRSDQMEFADHGIVTIAGQHEIPAGINRIKERFQTDRLFIRENCVHLIDELKRYRWRKPPQTENAAQQRPVSKDDHLIDALRYVLMSRPYLPDKEAEEEESVLKREIREHQRQPPAKAQTDFGPGMFR